MARYITLALLFAVAGGVTGYNSHNDGLMLSDPMARWYFAAKEDLDRKHYRNWVHTSR